MSRRLTTRRVQLALRSAGISPGPIDGLIGPRTNEAIVLYKRSIGIENPNAQIDDDLLAHLFGVVGEDGPVDIPGDVPWLNEINAYMGLHEVRNKETLWRWLRSDGRNVGDPSKFPWCADAVQTAILNTLPKEPFTGRVAANPYLARNWEDFGQKTSPHLGVIAVFNGGKRPPPAGHVGFLVGFDEAQQRFRVRGGNQSNSISDTWIGAKRLLHLRKPVTYKKRLPLLPSLNSAGEVVSSSEG